MSNQVHLFPSVYAWQELAGPLGALGGEPKILDENGKRYILERGSKDPARTALFKARGRSLFVTVLTQPLAGGNRAMWHLVGYRAGPVPIGKDGTR